MTLEDWFDPTRATLKVTSPNHRRCLTWGISLDGWQVAGVSVLAILVLPALITGTSEDWSQALGHTLLSSPLLAWFLIPLRRSDDLFDEPNRRRAEWIDLLAVVLLWTWPWTCTAPLAVVGRLIKLFLARA